MAREIGAYSGQIGAFVNRHCHRYYRRSQPEDRLDRRNEVALIAHRRGQEVEGADEAQFVAWLGGISKNVVRNASRRQGTVAKYAVSVHDADERELRIEDLPSEEPTPDVLLLDQERADTVQQAIAQLPLIHQQVVWLFYIEQMPEKNIAERLGIRKGTVKSRLHSARQRLAESLLPLVEDD